MAFADFLGTLVHEQDEQRRVRVVDRNAFRDGMEEHRLAGARRRDDQCALSVADWGDEVDRTARSPPGPTFAWPSGFEKELCAPGTSR
jgi:hypothetical protein